MYNLNDNSNTVLQKIKYKGLILNLYNREFIPSEERPLGYKKELVTYSTNEKIYQNIILVENKNKIQYLLSWELLLDENKFFQLYEIYNNYLQDLNYELDYSFNIFGENENSNISSKLLLEDNRIKDYTTNSYKEYEISIKNISNISEFFFRYKKVKFTMEAETI